MIHQNDLQIWEDSMMRTLKSGLQEVDNSTYYEVRLPSTVSLISEEYRALSNFGNPVLWLIQGKVGTQAFVIGRMQETEPVDDGSEKHLNPPTLTRALSSLGAEYTYCQLAILIIPKEIELSSQQESWLSQWSEQKGNIRYLYLRMLQDDTDEGLAQQILKNLLLPWQTINNTDSNNGDNAGEISILENTLITSDEEKP